MGIPLPLGACARQVAEIEGTEPFPSGLASGAVNDLVDTLTASRLPTGDLVFKVVATATGADGRAVTQQYSIDYIRGNESGGIPGFEALPMLFGVLLFILVLRKKPFLKIY